MSDDRESKRCKTNIADSYGECLFCCAFSGEKCRKDASWRKELDARATLAAIGDRP